MTRSHLYVIPLLLPALLLLASFLPGCDTPTEPEFDWSGLLTDKETQLH